MASEGNLRGWSVLFLLSLQVVSKAIIFPEALGGLGEPAWDKDCTSQVGAELVQLLEAAVIS